MLVVYNLTRDDDPPALASVDVPDVVGQPQAEAERILQEAGLVPVPVLEESTTVPAGTVISQDPAPGEPLDEGSNVTINVSSGTTQIDGAACPSNSDTVRRVPFGWFCTPWTRTSVDPELTIGEPRPGVRGRSARRVPGVVIGFTVLGRA